MDRWKYIHKLGTRITLLGDNQIKVSKQWNPTEDIGWGIYIENMSDVQLILLMYIFAIQIGNFAEMRN